MAEETQNASLNVPRGIIGSYLIGSLSGLVMLITFCFCLQTDALDSATGFPFMAVYQTSTGSAGGAIALTVIIIVLTFFSATNFMASASRQTYAFARDGGLPFSATIAKVSIAGRGEAAKADQILERSITSWVYLWSPSS